MLGDLSQATDELRTEGGGGPTAAVQTFFEKHHKTRRRPRQPACARPRGRCRLRAASAVDHGGLLRPDVMHMLASNGRSGAVWV